jgi:uncharacterized membrane protein YiaA
MRGNTFMGLLVLVIGVVLFLIGMRKRGALLLKELQVK